MGRIFSATFEGEEALASATLETVMCLIGAATREAKIIEWGLGFDGIDPVAAPAVVRIIRTTADDGTASAATENPWTPGTAAALCAVKHSYTVEPTKAAQPLAVYEVHPQAGIVMQYPLGREIELAADATDGVAFDVNIPVGVNCIGYVVWEE